MDGGGRLLLGVHSRRVDENRRTTHALGGAVQRRPLLHRALLLRGRAAAHLLPFCERRREASDSRVEATFARSEVSIAVEALLGERNPALGVGPKSLLLPQHLQE